MQEGLVRKLDLEVALSKIEPHPKPKAYLEQYTITVGVAAELLRLAAYSFNDIIDKKIVDLGCGTGRLAIGSILLGAKAAIGVDIDRIATRIASRSAEKLGARAKTQWINADINGIVGAFDTVLQNPPFGIQRRKADRRFLEKALKIGNRIYSLHKTHRRNQELTKKLRKQSSQFIPSSPSLFLKRLIEQCDGQIEGVYTTSMEIPHMFSFHRKKKHNFLVDLYVIQKS